MEIMLLKVPLFIINLEQLPNAAIRIDYGNPVWANNPRTVGHWDGNTYIWGMIS
jgi:hypothetical protein